MKLKYFGLALLFLACIMSSSCSDMTKAKPAAEESVKKFHTKYNDQKFDDIYQESDPEFKKATNFDSFNEFLSAVHRKLGNVTSTENAGWHVKTFNFVTTTTIQQKTQFDHGDGVETFTFRVNDGKVSLVGYNINSMALIIK